MKYFTQTWVEGNFSEAETNNICQLYWQQIKALESRLSPQVAELASRTNLHDGLIRKVIFNTTNRSLHLGLRCGDLQEGYFDLDLDYSDTVLTTINLDTLRMATLDPKTEILYDEVDLSEIGYVHRLLFWPYREVEIVFSQLLLAKRSSPNREIPASLERFVKIPGNSG